MTVYYPPKKNKEFVFFVSLVNQSNRPFFKLDPTIATGDFQVSTDGGALANLDTLPVVAPAGSPCVKIVLSADEMDGSNVNVIGSDAADDEWDDVSIHIHASDKQFAEIFTTSDRTALQAIDGREHFTAVDRTELQSARKMVQNDQELFPDGRYVTYEDDGATVFDQQMVTDKDGLAIQLDPGAPAKRKMI